MPQVHAILLNQFPQGLPKESDFRTETVNLPDLKEDELLVKTLYLSTDPYIRPLLKKDSNNLGFPTFQLNQVLKSGGIGRIVKALSPGWAEDQLITGTFNWSEYNIFSKEDQKSLQKVDFLEGLPESYALGCLGMPGMTAYNGLLEICNPKEGETLVVSAAAGAVGSLVGQIGKIKGCKVVGIVGSDQKCKIIKNLGFDAAINYKTPNLMENLKQACPNGIDCYFDNVGGETLDTVIDLLNVHARVALCGSVSDYNRQEESTGPRKHMILIGKSVKMQGFTVFRDFPSKFPDATRQMIDWIKQGKIKYHETVIEGGVDKVPNAFIQMLTGENIGKTLVKITETPQVPTE